MARSPMAATLHYAGGYVKCNVADPPDVNAKATIQSTAATPPEPPERIFVTIAAAETSISPADRVLTIYPHFTAGEASPGPGGLTVL